MEAGFETTSFSNPGYRAAKVLTNVLIVVLLGLVLQKMAIRATSYTVGYMVVVALIALYFLVAAVRSSRAGFTLDDRGITARSAYSTRRWRYEQIERGETVDRLARGAPMNISRAGFTKFPVEPRTHIIPVLWLANGRRVAMQSLRLTSSNKDALNYVDDAMIELNARIARRRGEDPTPR